MKYIILTAVLTASVAAVSSLAAVNDIKRSSGVIEPWGNIDWVSKKSGDQVVVRGYAEGFGAKGKKYVIAEYKYRANFLLEAVLKNEKGNNYFIFRSYLITGEKNKADTLTFYVGKKIALIEKVINWKKQVGIKRFYNRNDDVMIYAVTMERKDSLMTFNEFLGYHKNKKMFVFKNLYYSKKARTKNFTSPLKNEGEIIVTICKLPVCRKSNIV